MAEEQNLEFPSAGEEDGGIESLINDVLPDEAVEPTPAEEEVETLGKEDAAPSKNKSGDVEIPDDLVAPNEVDPPDAEDEEEEVIEEPEGLDKASPKTQEAFASMRTTIKSLKAELAAAKSQGGDEALQERVKELEGQIEQVNFAKSPRFAREYAQPIQAVREQLLQVGKDYGLEEGIIAQAARLGRAERNALLSQEISDQNGMSELVPLFGRYFEAVQNAQNAVKEFEQNREQYAQQHEQEIATARTEALSAAEKDLFESGFTLLQESTKNPNWLPGLRSAAESILNGDVEPGEFAKAALAGVVARPQIIASAKQIANLKAELESTKKQLSKYVKLSPKAGGFEAPAPKKTDAPASIEDLVADIA